MRTSPRPALERQGRAADAAALREAGRRRPRESAGPARCTHAAQRHREGRPCLAKHTAAPCDARRIPSHRSLGMDVTTRPPLLSRGPSPPPHLAGARGAGIDLPRRDGGGGSAAYGAALALLPTTRLHAGVGSPSAPSAYAASEAPFPRCRAAAARRDLWFDSGGPRPPRPPCARRIAMREPRSDPPTCARARTCPRLGRQGGMRREEAFGGAPGARLHPALYRGLGVSVLERRYDEANPLRAASRHAHYVRAHATGASCFFERRRYADASGHIARRCGLQGDPWWRPAIGRCLLAQRRYDEAEAQARPPSPSSGARAIAIWGALESQNSGASWSVLRVRRCARGRSMPRRRHGCSAPSPSRRASSAGGRGPARSRQLQKPPEFLQLA